MYKNLDHLNPENLSREGIASLYGFSPEPADIFPSLSPRLLHEQVSLVTQRFPDRVACSGGDLALTYAELSRRANRLAHWLIDRGVRVGDRVALLPERSTDMVVTLLAILKAGAAYVPLDHEWPARRRDSVLEDSAPVLLLCAAALGPDTRTGGPDARVGGVPIAWLEEALGLSVTYSAEDPGLPMESDEVAYIVYTSGSTGKPKGVMIEHHNVVQTFMALQSFPGIDETDRVLAIAALTFDVATAEIFLPLTCGAEVVVAPLDLLKDGRALIQLAERERITLMQATPSTWQMLLNAGWKNPWDAKVMSCGETLPVPLAAQLGPLCRELYNLYGPTETTIYATAMRVYAARSEIPIGRPLAGAHVHVVDQNFQPVLPGEVGEICIGGEGVGRGYINLGQLTGEKFIADPFSLVPGARLYRTGDFGTWNEEGDLEFHGRIDDQVKVRGHRVELQEIEHQLLTLEGIREAVVVFREDRPGERQLVAYVVGVHENVSEWKPALRRILPGYMVPAAFVLMDTLPLTPHGKVDRKCLPPPVVRGCPEGHPPRTDMEKLVAEVWADVLGIPEVYREDDFFELGGHSLIAVEMMVRLERKTGKHLPVALLFKAPTVAQLARELSSPNRSDSWKSLVPIKPSGTKPPLYLVHGIGLRVMVFYPLARSLDADQPVYGLQAKGLDGIEEPLTTIESIASHYLSEILESNPVGPYYLGGYSLGGAIAFEMAKQLREKGKEVKLLAMLDAYAGHLQASGSRFKAFLKKLERQPAKFRFIARSFAKDPRATMSVQWNIISKRWLSTKKGFSRIPGIDDIPGNRISDAMLEAVADYRLTPDVAEALDIFRVKERNYFLHEEWCLGWKTFAAKGIQVYDVEGDHRSFLDYPNCISLAELLQRIIDERGAVPQARPL